jgi:hypothetical protein
MSKKYVGLSVLSCLFFILVSFAVSWAENPTSLIVVRASNNTLWKATCDGTTCSSWSLISGQFAQQPTLTWDEKLRKYVLIGVSTVGTIWMSTFNADGSHNDNWVQLSGSTPSPVAVAGSDLKISDIHDVGSNSVSVATLTVCPTFTNITSTTHKVDRFGFLRVNADGIYVPGTAGVGITVCIADTSGGGNCNSLQFYLASTSAMFDVGAHRPYAMGTDYQVDPGSKTVYLKACKESSATGTLWWDKFATTWHGWDY